MSIVRFEVANGSTREVGALASEANGEVMVRVEIDASMAGPCGMKPHDAVVAGLEKVITAVRDAESRRIGQQMHRDARGARNA